MARIFNIDARLLAAALIAASGCSSGSDGVDELLTSAPPVDLSNRDQAALAARYSDPLWMLRLATHAYEEVPKLLEPGADPRECPRVINNSDFSRQIIDAVIIGDGCAIGDDNTVVGRMVVKGNAEGGEIRYENFGVVVTGDCSGQTVQSRSFVDGTVHAPYAFLIDGEVRTSAPEGQYRIRARGTLEEFTSQCTTGSISMAYAVDIEAVTEGSSLTFDVSGQVAASIEVDPSDPWPAALLSLAPQGSWEVSAPALVHDLEDMDPFGSICREAIAGDLTIRAGGRSVVIHADGETSCSEEACAPWSLDSVAQPDQLCGLAANAGCSAGPGSPAPWTIILLVASVLFFLTRRRRAIR